MNETSKLDNKTILILDIGLGLIQRIEKIVEYNQNNVNFIIGFSINCKVNILYLLTDS